MVQQGQYRCPRICTHKLLTRSTNGLNCHVWTFPVPKVHSSYWVTGQEDSLSQGTITHCGEIRDANQHLTHLGLGRKPENQEETVKLRQNTHTVETGLKPPALEVRDRDANQ